MVIQKAYFVALGTLVIGLSRINQLDITSEIVVMPMIIAMAWQMNIADTHANSAMKKF